MAEAITKTQARELGTRNLQLLSDVLNSINNDLQANYVTKNDIAIEFNSDVSTVPGSVWAEWLEV